jgi:hypothetical protein
MFRDERWSTFGDKRCPALHLDADLGEVSSAIKANIPTRLCQGAVWSPDPLRDDPAFILLIVDATSSTPI